ncbi:malonate decarboxylase subunit epsilon [Cupriavidus sp. SW-Y-13]|uniref:malonate decarboxylase subunit epsilon n=1 Tax=Cupriavidus sp. SW-Y-13 TaxID=2653854 RepID=UPI0013656706|nr:malonate decarboxylase subunit epsilon [Cupriavidus sp. SW-Y-13]MWL91127.1 malonate decarboxylase subunit epsilon [Cupriavidus sp. SW-Y-13]
MPTLLTFPGQGAQRTGMLHALPDHAVVTRTLEQASDALGEDVLRHDDAEHLASTVSVQLCLLVAGVASARALLEDGPPAHGVAGLSIGAYAAAVVAGALSFADAVRLVKLRGTLMAEAYPRGYGMTAILGIDVGQLAPLVASVNTVQTPVFIANYNADTQLVIAGSDDAMARVSELALAAGARTAQRVAIAVPSHCALLDDAAARLQSAFAEVTVKRPTLRYFSASAARELRDPVRIAEDLARNMALPVRWHETMLLARAVDFDLAVEMPPGSVLTKLCQPMFPQAVALAEMRGDSVRVLMGRAQDG